MGKQFTSLSRRNRVYATLRMTGRPIVHITVAIGLMMIFVLLTPSVSLPLEKHRTKALSPLDSPHLAGVTFSDDTLNAGITFSHLQGDEHLTGINETLGAGVCAFDYDNDGRVDLFLINGTGQTRYYGVKHWWHLGQGNVLYRNTGDGRFQDVTGEAGLDDQRWGMGCAAADFDNDGDDDLLVTNYGADLLYRNDGDGTFDDVTEASGIAGDAWSTSAALADFDDDGLLDVYVTHYIRFEKGASTYEGASQFRPNVPRSFSPGLYVAQANSLYRNLGDLKFEDITERAGVGDSSGRGLSADWLDINGDRRPDLVVANGAGTTNVAYVNQGDGRFEEVGNRYLLNDARGSNGLGVGDFNSDGFFDIAVSTGIGNPPLLLMNEPGEGRPDRIFRNRSRALGIDSRTASVFSGWGIAPGDFNNDGRLDLFQVNGLTTPDPDTSKVPLGQPKRLWLQGRAGGFRDASADSGAALSDSESARGLAIADFDNDGDLDAYVAHNNGLGQLLTNRSRDSHWLGVVLEGRRDNRDAIGATASLRTAGEIQYRRVDGNGFLSTSDRRLHFGLGDRTRVDELTVTWPDGTQDILKDLPVDRYLRIVQGSKRATTARAPGLTSSKVALGLRVGASDPAHRIQYIKWLVATRGAASLQVELRAAARDPDPVVRSATLEVLARRTPPTGLALVTNALEDPAPSVRLAALEAARAYESEASVRWLLRAFRDPDPRVRTALAGVFQSFFDEEEAVIYRKFLAVPPLVRLLHDSDAGVRRAAALALGASERYRAVAPLMARLVDDQAEVRAAVTAALGRIRDREAVNALRAVLTDVTETPNVRAQSMIALKRLDALEPRSIQTMCSDVSKSPGKITGVRDCLEIMEAVFHDKAQAVVLARDKLLGELDGIDKLDDPAMDALTIDVLEAAGGRSAVKRLGRFTDHPDSAIRRRAYLALVKTDRPTRAKYYRAALTDSSAAVRIALLMRLASDSTTVPTSVLLNNLEQTSTRLPAIRAVRGTSNPEILRHLYRIAIDDSEAIDTRVAAIRSSISAAVEMPPLPEGMLSDKTPAPLRLAAIRFRSARTPGYTKNAALRTILRRALRDLAPNIREGAADILMDRHEPWAKRLLVDVLLEDDFHNDTRRRIIRGLDRHDIRAVERTLLRLAEDPQNALRMEAIYALAKSSDPPVHAALWRILNDAGEEDDVRFAAARALPLEERETVLEKLRAG